MTGYKSDTQNKNLAWFLPRPKPDHYKGGMPLYAEEWLIELAQDILGTELSNGDILSLFAGASKRGYKVDVKPETSPDLVADAHDLSALGDRKFRLIIADPPYSDEESKELYGTSKLNYSKWTAEATKHLEDSGILIVYHKYVVPNPNPEIYAVEKRVFIGTRTWHLPRVAVYFRHGHPRP